MSEGNDREGGGDVRFFSHHSLKHVERLMVGGVDRLNTCRYTNPRRRLGGRPSRPRDLAALGGRQYFCF